MTVGYGKNSLSEDHSRRFDLYCALNRPQADWFSAQLYRLFQKADPINKKRLGVGFPLEYQTFMDWYNCDDEHEFFREVSGGR